jgi:hypothetical protein
LKHRQQAPSRIDLAFRVHSDELFRDTVRRATRLTLCIILRAEDVIDPNHIDYHIVPVGDDKVSDETRGIEIREITNDTENFIRHDLEAHHRRACIFRKSSLGGAAQQHLSRKQTRQESTLIA